MKKFLRTLWGQTLIIFLILSPVCFVIIYLIFFMEPNFWFSYRLEEEFQVITHKTWISLSIVLLGSMGIFLSKCVPKEVKFIRSVLFCSGILMVACLAPSIFLGRITLSEGEYSVRSGFYGLKENYTIELHNLKQVTKIYEPSFEWIPTKNQSRTKSPFLRCEHLDGSIKKRLIKSPLNQYAVTYLIVELDKQGISYQEAPP